MNYLQIFEKGKPVKRIGQPSEKYIVKGTDTIPINFEGSWLPLVDESYTLINGVHGKIKEHSKEDVSGYNKIPSYGHFFNVFSPMVNGIYGAPTYRKLISFGNRLNFDHTFNKS